MACCYQKAICFPYNNDEWNVSRHFRSTIENFASNEDASSSYHRFLNGDVEFLMSREQRRRWVVRRWTVSHKKISVDMHTIHFLFYNALSKTILNLSNLFWKGQKILDMVQIWNSRPKRVEPVQTNLDPSKIVLDL